jgi:hypothetical protein
MLGRRGPRARCIACCVDIGRIRLDDGVAVSSLPKVCPVSKQPSLYGDAQTLCFQVSFSRCWAGSIHLIDGSDEIPMPDWDILPKALNDCSGADREEWSASPANFVMSISKLPQPTNMRKLMSAWSTHLASSVVLARRPSTNTRRRIQNGFHK